MAGLVPFERHHRDLAKHVESIRICALPPPSKDLSLLSQSNISHTTSTMEVDEEEDENLFQKNKQQQQQNNVYATSINSSTLTSSVLFWQAEPHIHVYQLDEDGPSQEYTGGGEGSDEDGISSLEQWCLPSTGLEKNSLFCLIFIFPVFFLKKIENANLVTYKLTENFLYFFFSFFSKYRLLFG